ncbi:zinc ribbon domain-containing protein [Chloroflexota bacterium]
MSSPFKLFRLQQTDNQIDHRTTRMVEIETALKDDEALKLGTSTLQSAEHELKELRKALHLAEDNVSGQRLKIEQTEATLYSGKVKNPKELQDLQNEAAALKRYLSVLEDRLLEAMLAEEEAASQYDYAFHELEIEQSRYNQMQNDLSNEKVKFENELARLQGERTATTGSIPEDDLILYQQLRVQRRGIAVAKVSNKACSACGSLLSATLLHSARSPNQITLCDTCGRILYFG